MKKIVLIILAFVLFTTVTVEAKKQEEKKIRPSTVVEAINKGDVVALQGYLDKGINPNGSYFGSQYLTYAIINKQDTILDLLLKNGASPNPEHEIPLLYFAVSEKNQYAVAKLLTSGADINKTYLGLTAKDLAKSYKNKTFINIFNAYEYNPDTFSPENYRLQTVIANKKAAITDKIEPIQPNNANQPQKTVSIFDLQAVYSAGKKDPKLIKITKSKPVNNKVYSTKVTNDNIAYKKYKSQLSEEYYNLYVILDKLLRANNLQYQNWRLGLYLNPEEINAQARANFITINSALYDSFYHDKDALAFVIAHELAHLILGHGQASLENRLRIVELENQIRIANNEADTQRNLGYLNNALGNGYSALGNNVASLAFQTSVGMMRAELKNLYEEERLLEIQADTEAVTLMSKAGYNPEKSKEVIVESY